MNGKADSFADYSDLVAYIHARDVLGLTHDKALALGDDGRGASGKVTSQTHTPMCALCPEHFQGHHYGDKVIVLWKNYSVLCELADVRPAFTKIKDGSIIELNPAFFTAVNATPDTIEGVSWTWL